MNLVPPNTTIIVNVGGGLVQSVENIPLRVTVAVRDYDNGRDYDKELSDEELAESGIYRDESGELYSEDTYITE